MSTFNGYTKTLKEMVSTPLTATSIKPSVDRRKIFVVVVSVVVVTAVAAIVTWLVVKGVIDEKLKPEEEEFVASRHESTEDGALVIHFNEKAAAISGTKIASKATGVRASTGTLIKVKLLNSLETYDTVPVFAQIVDHSLGSRFYGWTVIGDASSDSNVDRIKMSFSLARSPKGNSSLGIKAQAISLDGTLGVRASKLDGVVNRSLLDAGAGAASGMSGTLNGASNDLSTILLRALLTGLQSEVSSDLGAAYNRAVAFSLKPGHEFFLQLTENF
jgi:hypothetical protein